MDIHQAGALGHRPVHRVHTCATADLSGVKLEVADTHVKVLGRANIALPHVEAIDNGAVELRIPYQGRQV